MTDGIRVLHVDDEPDFADLAATYLEREDERITVDAARAAGEGLDRLEDADYDCVVSDYDMPGQNGIEFLRAVREREPDLPFILFTGKGSEEVASEAISAGVSDYLQKDAGTEQYELLANRVRNQVERTRAQRHLEEREAHLSHAQEMANLGSWRADVVANELVWSEEGGDIYGVTDERMTYDEFLSSVHPDDRAAVDAAWKDALTGDEYDVEHRIVTADGETRWVRSRADVEFDADGTPVAAQGVVQDVTERKEREQELQLFQEAVEAAGHSIYWTDRDGTIQYVNPAFEETTGYAESEAVGLNPRILKSGEHDEAFYERMWETITAGETWREEVINAKRDGEDYVIDQTIAPVTDDAGEISHFVAVNADITEYKEREQALQEERDRREALFQNPSDAVVEIEFDDEAAVIQSANETFRTVFGFDHDAVVGEHVSDVLVPASTDVDERHEEIKQRVLDGESVLTEVTRQTADGPREFQLRVFPFDVADGRRGSYAIYTDVTERRERQRELERQQAKADRFEDLLEHALTGTDTYAWEWDLADDCITRFPTVEPFYGASSDEIGGVWEGFLDRVHPADRERVEATIREGIESGEGYQFECRVRTVDEGWRWVRDRATVLADDGEPVRAVGTVTDIDDLKTYERDLEEYRTLVETVGDAMYMVDEEGYIEMANDAMAAYLETEPEALLGTRISEYMADGDFERGTDQVLELLENPERQWARFEVTAITSTGDRIPAESRIAVLTDDHGEFRGNVGVVRDIADRKERELELERYETMANTVPDMLYILDGDGRFQFVNDAAERLTGYESAELVGEHAELIMEEGDLEAGRELTRELLSADGSGAGEALEWTLHTADGETVPCETHMTLLEADGEWEGTVGVVRDVSDRKRRERELERYETIIEASGDAVYMLDPDGRFTFVNESFTDVTGYDESTILGEHASLVMDEGDIERGEALLRELLEGDRDHATFEMTNYTADGREIPMENHLAVLTTDDGRLDASVGIKRDITERRERERELERQNERLEELAGVISHDLRNPLNVANGRLELARDTCDSEHLEALEGALDRMETLIDDLLTLAREGESVREPDVVDLAGTVNAAWRNVDTGEATLRCEAAGRLRADPGRLKQLLENLVRNAIEHGGETVTVTVGNCEGGFYVADDGPGIPPEDRERVFDHGYSTAAGSGLGLNIVEQIAEAHDWAIAVTESEAGGARFELTGIEDVG